MLIYKDIFTQDELASDSFPMKLWNGLIYEFTGKHVVRKQGEVSFAGLNPSAEEQDEGTDEAVERGIDCILNHSLQDMTSVYADVKTFKEWIKEYMKKLVDHMKANGASENDLKEFKTKMQDWVGGLIKKERFKDLQFFCGAGENASEGQLAILEYREVDGEEKPIVMFIKPGLEEEKC